MAELPPQTPPRGSVYLDHVGWFVPDLAKAGAAFERLAFVLTPFAAQHNADPAGGPPQPAGTANRCAMLRRGYLEFLTAVPGADAPLAAQLRAALDHYAGVHLIAFTVADAEAAHRRLAEAGFAPQPPVHLRRPLTLPDGSTAEAGFTVIRVPPGAMPEGRIQILTQENPDLVWQDSLIARDNGVTALSGVLLCVTDPAEAAARFARFTGRPAAGRDDYFSLALDRGRLAFASTDRCAALLPGAPPPGMPAMVAVSLAADDPARMAALCANRGVPLLPSGDGTVRVAPAAACGAALVIHRADAPWPPSADQNAA